MKPLLFIKPVSNQLGCFPPTAAVGNLRQQIFIYIFLNEIFKSH